MEEEYRLPEHRQIFLRREATGIGTHTPFWQLEIALLVNGLGLGLAMMSLRARSRLTAQARR